MIRQKVKNIIETSKTLTKDDYFYIPNELVGDRNLNLMQSGILCSMYCNETMGKKTRFEDLEKGVASDEIQELKDNLKFLIDQKYIECNEGYYRLLKFIPSDYQDDIEEHKSKLD